MFTAKCNNVMVLKKLWHQSLDFVCKTSNNHLAQQVTESKCKQIMISSYNMVQCNVGGDVNTTRAYTNGLMVVKRMSRVQLPTIIS